VTLSFFSDDATTWGLFDETKLNQKWLVIIFNRGSFITSEGGNGGEADGAGVLNIKQ